MSWRIPDDSGLLTLGEGTAARPGAGSDFSLPGPEGHILARVRAHRLWFVDSRTGRKTPRSPRLSEIWGLRWSPDSRRLLSWGPDGRIRVWDAHSGRQLAARSHFVDLLPVAFSPDTTRIYLPDGAGRLETLNTETLRPVRSVAVRTGIAGLIVQPRDGSVLVARSDGSMERVDPTTGRSLAETPPGTLREGNDTTLAMSPDGSVVAAADSVGHLRLLDAETLVWVSPDSGMPWGFDRDFAPDGSQVAAVTAEGVSLWDGRTGAYLARLPLPVDPDSVSIAYLGDSSGLVIAAADGRTWTADTRTETWVDRACTIAGRNLTQDEWAAYFPSRPYHATCPQWPERG
jgi:WD40 repeat protein